MAVTKRGYRLSNQHAAFWTQIFIFFITQSFSAQSLIPNQPNCNVQSENPNSFVKDVDGNPIPLRNNTPYAIKNVATGHVFVHLAKDINLLKLSHWWELIFEKSPNIYKLQNIDSNIHSKMPLLIRTIQLRATGRGSYTLHPTSCSRRSSLKDGGKRLESQSWIYFDFIDENGEDQVDCESYNSATHTKPDPKYEYTFTPVDELLASKNLMMGEKIVTISNDPNQSELDLFTSTNKHNVHSQQMRSAIINNCGSGKVEQDVSFVSETSARSRLHVENTFHAYSSSFVKPQIEAGGGGKILGIFDIWTGVTMSWSQENVEDKFSYEETTFVQEQVLSVGFKEKIRVGNHSCLRVDARSAFLENFELPVFLKVKFQLVNATSGNPNQNWDEDDANQIFQLMKFSGKSFTYDDSTRSIIYEKKGKIELTTMLSMKTNIQQVVCDCKKN